MKLDLRNPVAVFLLAIVFAMLQACATRPQSATDYVKTAEAQVGGIYRTIGDLKAQGLITAEQGRTYFARNEALEKNVAIANRAVAQGDAVTAQTLAQAALSALAALSVELNQRK